MPDREALQSLLEDFRTAGQNLQLEPLVTRKALAQFGVEYQTELIDQLEQAIEDCAGQDNKLIFTGHRGCGKSTLLAVIRIGTRGRQSATMKLMILTKSFRCNNSPVPLKSPEVRLLEEVALLSVSCGSMVWWGCRSPFSSYG
jgi:Mitochondrial ribosomal death-associated protein 3